jgi:hypothetical protein
MYRAQPSASTGIPREAERIHLIIDPNNTTSDNVDTRAVLLCLSPFYRRVLLARET